jgi:hypothetical protein
MLLYGRPVRMKMEQSDWFSEQSESCSPAFFRHYNKHLIDQACLVHIGGYWSCKMSIQTQKSTRPISPYPDLALCQ